ncbi:MAG: MFS transporter [Bacteroidales bacterium]|jgi:GPH family glycoside/pentoside/hexuronide:cation symporter|nr:MFS transporter [Bacteroidales bacterium]
MIKLREKIGYGLGDMSSSMFWKIFGSYLMIFYTDVFGISAAAVGTMFLVSRLFDAINDPVMGAVADRTDTKWGKFRPYILWFAIPFAIIGVLTFYTPSFSSAGKLIYAYVTYIIMMVVYTIVNVPYASLLGVMSPDPRERNVLSTFRMTFAYLGSFIALLLFMPMVNAFCGGDNNIVSQRNAWTMAVGVMGVVCTLLFFGCFSLTKERVRPIKKAMTPLKDDLRDLAHNGPWWILLGSGIAALIFNSIRDGAAVYYFKYYIVESDYSGISFFGIPFVLSGVYLAVGQIANIIGVVLAAPVSNMIGKKKTYMGAMAIATVLSIIFYWFDKNDITLIFIFQFLISICAGSIFPILWSMYADCADYSEMKTGNRATGLIFSSSSMSQKFGWTIGSALTGWLLAYFGFRANQVQNAETINGLKLFMSWLPAAGTVLSVLFVSFYPLSENKMKDITEKLRLRRSKLS